MAKSKFDILDETESKNVVAAAALSENTKLEKRETVNINLTAFPKELHEALKQNRNQGGETVVGFIKRAARSQAKQEGII